MQAENITPPPCSWAPPPPGPCSRRLINIPLKDIIRNFTPSWFSVTMGTGILGTLLYTFPYQFSGLKYIAGAVFTANVILYIVFSAITYTRYLMFPEIIKLMLAHPQQSMFVGTIPMGLATIVNSIILMIPSETYPWAPILAWVLWWVDVALTLASIFVVPFSMILVQTHSLQLMTAAWLLPVVPAIVAAASGGLLAPNLGPQQAVVTILVSYVLWGVGVSLAAIILSIYFQRLIVHRLPPAEVIVSVFLPLGPLGQGSYGIMKLGMASKQIFPHFFPQIPLLGDIFEGVGIFVGLLMWGFALWWTILAVYSIFNYSFIKKTLPFNMGWWGFTFPIGTYTSATITLATLFDSAFFRVLGSTYTVLLLLLWGLVLCRTVAGTWSGKLISAPCLNSAFRAANGK